MTTSICPSRSNVRFGVCLFSAGLVLTLCGCTVVPPPGATPKKASDWVSFVNWNEAIRVDITAEEDGDHFHFMPANVTFEAGKPYILKMSSPMSNGAKHYFHTDGFYKAIATRKAQTVDAEYKAPYFDDFELLIGGSIELYFVPVIAGTYDMWCTIPGHREAGMEGTWTITDGEGNELDLEVAVDFNSALMTDARRSGSHDVWQEGNLASRTVTLTEFEFIPHEFTLTKDVAYKLTLIAPATNAEKHYHTAAELYKTVVTRKAQDSQAEIKVPYFKAVELLVGGSTDLYIVPTVAGCYELICTVPGHADLGMTGTIAVQTDVASAVSFSADIQPIFDANCIGCHATGGIAGDILHLNAGESHLALVHPEGGHGAEADHLSLVTPGDAQESLLYLKVSSDSPPVGTRMPLGAPALSDAEIGLIRDWIDRCAPDN